jgi:hypothetical protein
LETLLAGSAGILFAPPGSPLHFKTSHRDVLLSFRARAPAIFLEEKWEKTQEHAIGMACSGNTCYISQIIFKSKNINLGLN